MLKARLLVFIATLLASPLARAAEPGEPVRIEFRGESGCPDKAAFMAGVRARSARVREASPGENARAFQVTLVRQKDGRFHGELAVVDAATEGPAERARSIDGDSCEEVVDALALFTVLSVDPAAVLGERTEASGEGPTEQNPGTEAPPPLSLAAPPPPVDRPVPPPPEPRRRARDESKLAFRAVAGMHGGIMAAGASAPLPAASAFSEIGLDDEGELGPTVHPVVRLSLALTATNTVTAPEGSAELRWTKLGFDSCPFVLRGTKSLAARPCFTFSEGLLNASGEIDEPKSVNASFRTVGGLVRGEWAVAHAFLLELSAGVELPLGRDTFYFEPDTIVYEVPAVVGVVTIGGGFRFL